MNIESPEVVFWINLLFLLDRKTFSSKFFNQYKPIDNKTAERKIISSSRFLCDINL